MSSTREQALKTRDTNLKKDPKYYVNLGVAGGSTITENTRKRGFGSMSPKRRKEIARKAGLASASKRNSNGN